MGKQKGKMDKEAILAAIEWDGSFPEEADENWLRDRDIIRALVDVEPWNYEELPEDIRNNREIALECVTIRGDVYEYLPEALKDDIEITETAILNGQSLRGFVNGLDKPVSENAAGILKRVELVTAAVKANGGNEMRYADKQLWEIKELAEYALSEGFCHLNYLPENLAAEKETVKCVLRNIDENGSEDDYREIISLPEQLRQDTDFLLELIGLQEKVFQVIAQTQRKPMPEEFVAKFPKLGEDFCKKAYAANKKCLKYMSKEMKAVVKA